MLAVQVTIVLACMSGACGDGHYMFFRDAEAGSGSAEWRGRPEARRVFGGTEQPLQRFGAACALLDRYWACRCSGAVVAPRWVLSAAHCLSAHILYVKYNTHQPSSDAGSIAPVLFLYKHPHYKVRVSRADGLPDVSLLHHDVGLVRTQRDMALAFPTRDLIAAIPLYDPQHLWGKEVEVLGFGRTERTAAGEQLYSARLALGRCGVDGSGGSGGAGGRREWLHCACALQLPDGGARGVCAGDSGGPVLHRGALVGVTSMGPLECSEEGGEDYSVVFTSLYHYAQIVNDTIGDTEALIKMHAVEKTGGCGSRFLSSIGLLVLSVSCALMRKGYPFIETIVN